MKHQSGKVDFEYDGKRVKHVSEALAGLEAQLEAARRRERRHKLILAGLAAVCVAILIGVILF